MVELEGARGRRHPSPTATSSSSDRCPAIQTCAQVSEADYPYVSGTTTDSEDCNYDLNAVKPVATITGYNNLPPNDQAAVMDHIAHV